MLRTQWQRHVIFGPNALDKGNLYLFRKFSVWRAMSVCYQVAAALYFIKKKFSWSPSKGKLIPRLVGPLTTHSSGSGRSSPISTVLSQQRAYTPALQLGALNNVGCRLHLSSRHLPFASITHFLHRLLLIYRPQKDERLSWPRWLAHILL